MAFSIIRNDITKVHADAIVNTANPKPVCGGGTDTAIYKAAGAEELLAARRQIGEIAPGHAEYTPAFALDAKYIIHTVGPVWEGGEAGEFETLANCYRNSLALAKSLGCTSIAFPLISTGVYGFPKDQALSIAVEQFRAFEDSLGENEEEPEILLVVFDRESFVLSGTVYEGVDAFVDGNYVEEKLDEEYAFEAADEEFEEDGRSRRFYGNRRDAADLSSAAIADEKRRFFLGSAFHKSVQEAAPAGSSLKKPKEKAAARVMEDACEAVCEAAPRSLDDIMSQVGETWQQSLFRLIDEKGYSDTEVYKRANVDRKLFSKIRSSESYQPKKMTAVAFALALRLNLDETKDFLGRAGYAFSPGSRFDLIVEYFIQNGIYDTYTINLALFDHDQPLIGA